MSNPTPQPAPTDSGGQQPCWRPQSLAERAGGIAHDLNNMLGAMMGYGALILDDLPLEDPNRVFAAKVIEAGEEAKRLVAELLEAAQGGSGDSPAGLA